MVRRQTGLERGRQAGAADMIFLKYIAPAITHNKPTWSHPMNKKQFAYKVVPALLLCALAACSTAPMAGQSATTQVNAVLNIPAPAAVTLDAKTTALLVLDIHTAVCQPNPACIDTVPAIASLIAKARTAKVPVIYSSTIRPA